MREPIRQYADTLFEQLRHESAETLAKARSEFAHSMARQRMTAPLPISGPEIRALMRLFAEHVERCMRGKLDSYHRAFDESKQLPADEEFREIWSEVQEVQKFESLNCVNALTQFASTHGGNRSQKFDLSVDTAHGYDRVLQAWKVWRAQIVLSRDTDGDDIRFARMAVEQAKLCVPEDDRIHPRVGVVVVQNGQVIAAAHRGETPGSHGEFIALEQKLRELSLVGTTVYTTLEPCTTRNHPKVPCAERLIERKVKRVVIGMLDPNPCISGRGQQKLRTASIITDFFPHRLMSEVEELNREFTRQFRVPVSVPEAQPTSSTAGQAPNFGGAQQVFDKWVNLGYERDIGLADGLKQQGFNLAWVSADKEARKLDAEGWEYALADQPDGSKARLKIHDHPAIGGYLVLLRKRSTSV